MANWIQGCTMCNDGIVMEVKRREQGGQSVNAACKEMAAEAAAKFPELASEFKAKRIMQRYRYHAGLENVSENRKPEPAPTPTAKPPEPGIRSDPEVRPEWTPPLQPEGEPPEVQLAPPEVMKTWNRVEKLLQSVVGLIRNECNFGYQLSDTLMTSMDSWVTILNESYERLQEGHPGEC